MKSFFFFSSDVRNISKCESFTARLYFVSSQESNTDPVTLKSITRRNHAALPKLTKWERFPSPAAFYRFHRRLRWAFFLQMNLFIECQTWRVKEVPSRHLSFLRPMKRAPIQGSCFIILQHLAFLWQVAKRGHGRSNLAASARSQGANCRGSLPVWSARGLDESVPGTAAFFTPGTNEIGAELCSSHKRGGHRMPS